MPDDPDWREATRGRSAASARRRANAVLLLVALAVMAAATVAFAVPMLITN
jgi:hypothetical protein